MGKSVPILIEVDTIDYSKSCYRRYTAINFDDFKGKKKTARQLSHKDHLGSSAQQFRTDCSGLEWL